MCLSLRPNSAADVGIYDTRWRPLRPAQMSWEVPSALLLDLSTKSGPGIPYSQTPSPLFELLEPTSRGQALSCCGRLGGSQQAPPTPASPCHPLPTLGPFPSGGTIKAPALRSFGAGAHSCPAAAPPQRETGGGVGTRMRKETGSSASLENRE